MANQTITLATLNLWRFTDWEARLPEIISLLKTLDADIVLLQEVQRDPTKDKRNQIEILNTELGYLYKQFSQACIKTVRKGVPLAQPVDHGLGVLSKFPFTTENIQLRQAEGDKEPRILMKNEFTVGTQKITVTNIHFANSDDWAEAHLKEALDVLKSRGAGGVLVGDFNIKNLSKHRSLYKDEYTGSMDLFEYVSYPKDGLSYDYVLIPKNFTFLDFQCRNEIVSDHKLLYTKIALF